ncbi:MAG: glycosyltransferase family 2 protein [Saprospiraceae bacterium]|nr:glycosyltransferase family 2 protein [Saprospiraceae bacterium]
MDSILHNYLSSRNRLTSLTDGIPSKELKMIVVIPAYQEKGLFQALDSLREAKKISGNVEVMPIINHPENAKSELKLFHEKQYAQLQKYAKEHSDDDFKVLAISPIEFSLKTAGVGMARQAGMDEAVRRFLKINKPDGIIINFDADCTCHPDYFIELDGYFDDENSKPCVGIGFEHPLDGLDAILKKGIVDYELHLRYYVQAQRSIGYPFAFHTLGSCFAVRANSYCEQGGMNQRKAGEDFYFMHKYSIHQQLGEISKPLVFPSARTSERVPFGTGKAMLDFQRSEIQRSYSLKAIQAFGVLFNEADLYLKNSESQMENFWMKRMPQAWTCLKKQGLLKEIAQLKANTSDFNVLVNRFRKWMNPFRLMKFLHDMRDSAYPDGEVGDCAMELLALKGINLEGTVNHEELLRIYRQLDYDIH